jgi:hypothetical protein
MNQIPILLISLWLEGRKMEYEELLQLKQLRNYTEAQRQNDGKKRLFFFKNTGNLHLLIVLLKIGLGMQGIWINSIWRIWAP